MIINHIRIKSSTTETVGKIYIDNVFQCFVLEDIHRDEKIKHETRIPAGNYKINLRREGGFYDRYCSRFNGDHPIIWLREVPEFSYVYYHIGNDNDNTSGCPLLGELLQSVESNNEVSWKLMQSTDAYLDFHKKIVNEISHNREVITSILDMDR